MTIAKENNQNSNIISNENQALIDQNLIDRKLLKNAVTDNGYSAKQIFFKYKIPIYNFCWRFLQNQAEAEDVMQDVFITLWKNLKDNEKWYLEIKTSFQAWLYTVARNKAIDKLRKQKARTYDDYYKTNLTDSSNPEDEYQKKSTKKQVLNAIEDLNYREKTAILMIYYEGVDRKTTASVLGVSIANLDSILFRTREILRKKLLAKD